MAGSATRWRCRVVSLVAAGAIVPHARCRLTNDARATAACSAHSPSCECCSTRWCVARTTSRATTRRSGSTAIVVQRWRCRPVDRLSAANSCVWRGRSLRCRCCRGCRGRRCVRDTRRRRWLAGRLTQTSDRLDVRPGATRRL